MCDLTLAFPLLQLLSPHSTGQSINWRKVPSQVCLVTVSFKQEDCAISTDKKRAFIFILKEYKNEKRSNAEPQMARTGTVLTFLCQCGEFSGVLQTR